MKRQVSHYTFIIRMDPRRPLTWEQVGQQCGPFFHRLFPHLDVKIHVTCQLSGDLGAVCHLTVRVPNDGAMIGETRARIERDIGKVFVPFVFGEHGALLGMEADCKTDYQLTAESLQLGARVH